MFHEFPEGRDEWSRILSLDAKPGAGIVAKIGPGFVLLTRLHHTFAGSLQNLRVEVLSAFR